MLNIINADVMDGLAQIADNSVHCVVTSPPYWGLRDYGTASWAGGDEGCDHKQTTARHDGGRVNVNGFHGSATDDSDKGAMNFRDACGKCGATRIDNQIGLEKTPELYVEKMVQVFREVRRVMRDDATLWLNLGDSYAGSWGNYGGHNRGNGTQRTITNGSSVPNPAYDGLEKFIPPTANCGLKPKDLVGIPWRVAFALQADGWWLRSDIIWSKPNPMPESVTDRPTKAHEYIFLLTKSERYYFDQDAVREPLQESSLERGYAYNDPEYVSAKMNAAPIEVRAKNDWHGKRYIPAGRNIRSVWTIPTQSFPDAHFATFPEEIAKRCIMAGTSERGCCAQCGAPWERVVEKSGGTIGKSWHNHENDLGRGQRGGDNGNIAAEMWAKGDYQVKTLGWQPTCTHNADTDRCVVLDPFAGSGTVGAVALELGRKAVLIELNEKYCELIDQRTKVTYGFQLASA